MLGLTASGASAPRSDSTAASVDSPEAALVESIRTHLAGLSSWRPDEIEVALSDRERTREALPAGARFRVLSTGLPSGMRSTQVPIEVTPPAGSPRTVWVPVDIRVRATLLQAARRLAYGKALEAEDLQESRIDVRDLRREYVRQRSQVIGSVLRRPLAPGDPVTRDCAAPPQLVRFGEIVRLRADAAGVEISALARAEQAGKLGDLISVRSIDFMRSLRARVVARGEVRVE
jgi:flagella basal body P-ring formation protein FlgA